MLVIKSRKWDGQDTWHIGKGEEVHKGVWFGGQRKKQLVRTIGRCDDNNKTDLLLRGVGNGLN